MASISEGEGECFSALTEIRLLRQAMGSSPFRLDDAVIVPRGFTPHVLTQVN